MMFPKLDKKMTISIMAMVATGIGMYGGMPEPPAYFMYLVKKFPILQWTLVYVLILQGAGDFDLKMSAVGLVIMYVMYKMMNAIKVEVDETKEKKQAEKKDKVLKKDMAEVAEEKEAKVEEIMEEFVF